MFRVGLVILLTAAVLACPYRCAARTAVALQQTQPKRSCACCTKTCRTNPPAGQTATTELPQSPAESDDACVCVCDGAVAPSPTISFMADLNWVDCRALATQMAFYSAEVLAFGHRPPDCIDAGIGLRLSMQSLLL
jgi:hypothetical protein